MTPPAAAAAPDDLKPGELPVRADLKLDVMAEQRNDAANAAANWKAIALGLLEEVAELNARLAGMARANDTTGTENPA